MIDCPECEGRRTRLRAALAASQGGSKESQYAAWSGTGGVQGCLEKLACEVAWRWGASGGMDATVAATETLVAEAMAALAATRPDRGALLRLVAGVRDECARWVASWPAKGGVCPSTVIQSGDPATFFAAAQKQSEEMRGPECFIAAWHEADAGRGASKCETCGDSGLANCTTACPYTVEGQCSAGHVPDDCPPCPECCPRLDPRVGTRGGEGT